MNDKFQGLSTHELYMLLDWHFESEGKLSEDAFEEDMVKHLALKGEIENEIMKREKMKKLNFFEEK